MPAIDYPHRPQPYKQIVCVNQLFRLLEDTEINYENPFFIRWKKNNARYLDIICRTAFCKAYMKYQINDDKLYDLTDFYTQHNHELIEKMVIIQQIPKKIQNSIIYEMQSLYITRDMITYYRKYHRCTYITLTKAKDYYILAFSCVLPNRDIGMFGIIMFDKASIKNVKEGIKQFARRKKEVPQTIICNHQQLGKICKTIYTQSNFILIDHEIPQNYKVRFGFSKITESVVIQNDWQKEHRKLVTYLRDNISPVEVKDIFECYRKLCLPFIPKTFVGLGIQLFHGLLMQQTSEQNIYFTSDVNKFLTNFPNKIKTCFNDVQVKDFIEKVGISSNNLLVDVYSELEEPVVRFLVNQQNRTFFCEMKALPTGQFQVIYRTTNSQKVTKQGNIWDCSCGLRIKTGLPCCHLMKVLLVLDQGIRQYVDPYWLAEKEEKQERSMVKAQNMDYQ